VYEISLAVSACLRSGTRADVAWLICAQDLDPNFIGQAIAITPGGGRTGFVANGGFDGPIIDFASRNLSTGRLVKFLLGPAEAMTSRLPVNSQAKFIIAPATQLPSELWPLLQARKPLALLCEFKDDELVSSEVYSTSNIGDAGDEIAIEFLKSQTQVTEINGKILTIIWPVTKLVIAGNGPIADALSEHAKLLGWQVSCDPRVQHFTGLVTSLSEMDCVVVMGHDVETSSGCLAAALESKVGYIGALGSQKMQANRAEWLAYRDITDVSRVYGPAGYDIGANTPNEIAISILAEAIEVLKSK